MSQFRYESLLIIPVVIVLLWWLTHARARAQMAAFSRGPEQTELPSSRVEVPLHFPADLPAVEVMVDGQGPFLFAIDTGAQGTGWADVTLVEKLGLEVTGRVQAGDGSGRRGAFMDVVRIESLSFGGATFKGLNAPSRDFNQRLPEGTEAIDGMLGFHSFADCLVTFDYPAKQLRIERGELPPADGEEILDLIAGDTMPAIDIEVGGTRLTSHIDSRHMGTLMVPGRVAKKLELGAEPVVVGRARTVVGEFEIKKASLAGSLKIGRHRIPEPNVAFAKIFPRANIGARVLEQFVITFDQKNRRVRFLRPTDQP